MDRVFTIGFTQKSAKNFFDLLVGAGVRRVIDVRLNNSSQLSGFAKKDDLGFFLTKVADIEYCEAKDLAPSKLILSGYQKGELSWEQYEQQYVSEISRRGVERLIDASLFEGGCLLCSEHKPHRCHRRLAVEYLNSCWDQSLEIKHLY